MSSSLRNPHFIEQVLNVLYEHEHVKLLPPHFPTDSFNFVEMMFTNLVKGFL